VCGGERDLYDILALLHSTDDMGFDFPKPINLQMYNSTAEVFVNKTSCETKLKHIDGRQNRVSTLRNKGLSRTVHVDTKINAADLFTKIVGKQDFLQLRDMIMKQKPSV